MDTIDIRTLTAEDQWRAAFPLVRRLYGDLTEEEYVKRLREMYDEGYRMFALFERGEMIAVAGAAPRTNFYDGRHLFVSDLVTRPDRRSEGYGSRLLRFLEEWARGQNCDGVTIESGLARDNAHRFYEEKVDMDRRCYTFKKSLDTV